MKENIDVVVYDENEFILDKTIKCPVCSKQFTYKQVKTGKVRFLGTDDDLRPIYEGIDAVKYDVIQCPNCGYSAISSFFDGMTEKQIAKVRENISAKFNPVTVPEGSYSYSLAIRRYKLALITAMAKETKISECAYICLKLSWLYRGGAEYLREQPEDNSSKIEEYEKREKQFCEQAYHGFTQAVAKEYPPICNMDESTVNYLLADLAYRCEDLEAAKQNAYLVISARTANRKLKDKARILVDEIKKTE